MNEKKKGFDLGSTLADVLGAVPGSDTSGPEKLEYIGIDKLDEDVENFYSMDGLEELAANIELVGLQQPLRVRENPKAPGRFLIVSGHRRRRALGILYEEAPEKWGRVPCIVERRAESDAMRELRLILANADTRRMSSADLSKQAERVEMLLYRLKEEGVEFPGRMRDHVAEACKVSKTKLATLKVIREKLIPELRQLWEAGALNETCAYRLAQAEQRHQIRLTEIFPEAELKNRYEWMYDNWIHALQGVATIHCPDDGAACANSAAREERATRRSDPCGRTCCIDCWMNTRCGNLCDKAKAVAKQKQEEAARRDAERKAEFDRQNAERARLLEEEKAECDAVWKRIGAAAAAATVSVREVAALLTCEEVPEDVEDSVLDECRARMAGTCRKKHGEWGAHDNPLYFDDLPGVSHLADLLHCSTDYLLGRTDELQPAAAEHIPAWKLLKCEDAWKRAITAADAAGVDIKEILAALFYGGNAEDVRDEDAQAVRDFADGGDAANVTDFPWEFPEELIYVADLVHCSTDYLLGRTDELQPAAAGWISVDDHYPKEGEFVFAATKQGVAVPAVYFRAAFMDSTARSTANERIGGVEWWMPRPRLPGDRLWMGEETLRGMLGKEAAG